MVYELHGVTLAVRSSSRALSSAISGRLRLLPQRDAGVVDLDFAYTELRRDDARTKHTASARSIYEMEGTQITYEPNEDLLDLRYGSTVAVSCDPRAGRVTGRVAIDGGETTWMASHLLFTLPLLEMLKRRGLFHVHAAAVAIGGRAVLFPGMSGAGKSTLTLALIKAGLDFLADDLVFVRQSQIGPRILAFPDEIDVTEETLRLFPEIAASSVPGDFRARPKRPTWPETAYDVRIVWEATPVALVFPVVTGAPASRLEALERAQALLALTPNVLLTEPASSQLHLDLLAGLVGSCPSYRLRMGRDLERLPWLLRAARLI